MAITLSHYGTRNNDYIARNKVFAPMVEAWREETPEQHWVVVSRPEKDETHIEETSYSHTISRKHFKQIVSACEEHGWTWKRKYHKTFGLTIIIKGPATRAEQQHLTMLRKAEALMDRARAYFKEQDTYYDMYISGNTVKVDITWGDWKHDHLFVDHVFTTILGAKHYSTEVTEEDGSDTYSAIHTYIA